MTDETKPSIEERYSSATSTSTMKMELERSMPIDVLTAAGWSQSRIGAALLRLHSEWDSAEKPRLHKSPHTGRREAQAWLLHEQKILMGKLKTLPSVRGQVEQHLMQWGYAEPASKSAAVLLWWLDQTCHHCHGTKYEIVPGTNRQSGKLCRTCQGSGLMPVPHGQDGRRLANWLDGCTQLARTQISKHLR
jgi:hypothetical protein